MKVFMIILVLAVSGSVYYAKYGHKGAQPDLAPVRSDNQNHFGQAQVNPYAVGSPR